MPEPIQPGFLPISRKILSDLTFSNLYRNYHQYPQQAWKILERWGHNRPERLILLDSQQMRTERKILEQAQKENAILDSPTGLQRLAQGWTEEEIMQEHGLNTDLETLTLDQEETPGPLPEISIP